MNKKTRKQKIKEAVKRGVSQYGETLRMLGEEQTLPDLKKRIYDLLYKNSTVDGVRILHEDVWPIDELSDLFESYASARVKEDRERLAELAHEQWSEWMRYMFSKCIPEIDEWGDAKYYIPKWAVDRWTRKLNTPYKDLPEDEKESDRKEADRVIQLLSPTPKKEEGK